ncbi:MAG: hypothetical protein QHH04_09410 [Methanolinea sp.]|jgi:radical SAM superfamily enzyme YgiQ (UPF0313 family)|nr:hypothetical protein [Methanolinea sp.]
MAKHILLIEPSYYTRFPPIGLLKLSSYHKSKGDTTEYIHGCSEPKQIPDRIYITSLFTWTWRQVWESVHYYKRLFPETPIHLGGIYASLLPEHAILSGADKVHLSICKKAENYMPDYTLVPEWDGSIVFSSRGCKNSCNFCAVPRIEGKMNSLRKSIKKYIWPNHSKIIFFDNNFLANKYWKFILNELYDLDKKVDFNQGIDASLITDEIASKLSQLKIDSSIRLAYDSSHQRKKVESAIEKLSDNGINRREIFVYTLFNYIESPEDFLNRVRDILNWGVVCYPMRYEPLYTLEKNIYVSPKWTNQQIEMVQQARRVIGFGGAFPPYTGLVNKFNEATCFEEAFELREVKK